MGYLIDTCIRVDAERGKISPRDVSRYTGTKPVCVSPVTIAELTYGAEITADENIRQKRMAAIARLQKKPMLRIDEITGAIFGRIAALLTKQGGGAGFRAQDIWLAGQSIQHNCSLLTSNKKDFADIPGVELIVFGE